MDYEWRIHGYLYIIHVSQGILFVTTRHAIQVERISTIPISAIFRCASLRSLGFPGFHPHPRIPIVFHFILGGTVYNQWSVWGQLVPPRIILEVFCLSVTFPEITKSRNIDFLMSPVTVFEEIQGHRCGIDVQSFSNPWIIQKMCFYWPFHGWRLGGVSLGQFVNNAMDIDGFI